MNMKLAQRKPLLLLVTIGILPIADTTTLHISPDGRDDAVGSVDAPIMSLKHLERLLRTRADVTEVVIHGGVYHGSLVIPSPKDAYPEKMKPLLVRAVEGEEVIIDGSQPLTAEDKPQPLEGAPGVYVVHNPEKFRTRTDRNQGKYPRVWDRKKRKRYLLAADLGAVKRFPVTFTMRE